MIPRKNELNIKGTKMRHPRYKIARGTYLSGVGQEDKDYYFKIPVVSPYYETIQIDDICVTFEQNGSFISSVPGLVRIESISSSFYTVQNILRFEKAQGFPMMPIIEILEDFDIYHLKKIILSWENYSKEMNVLQDDIYAELERQKLKKQENAQQQLNLFEMGD
ncbi:hypothetical protein [Enterococcus diestrammenae]|uniref:Uncharacterized protein n=1 Tax=Enterococcus diestrammenae TaxID=1155073 RepID=A0ABV0F1W9_9ENTE|nr:hypothetical protein [Enterococcus diestrammenae]KAF1295286.1 hypothetical protein BAU18_10820 [Enterococcus diestrammenae]